MLQKLSAIGCGLRGEWRGMTRPQGSLVPCRRRRRILEELEHGARDLPKNEVQYEKRPSDD
jgi:hypothetical protein